MKAETKDKKIQYCSSYNYSQASVGSTQEIIGVINSPALISFVLLGIEFESYCLTTGAAFKNIDYSTLEFYGTPNFLNPWVPGLQPVAQTFVMTCGGNPQNKKLETFLGDGILINVGTTVIVNIINYNALPFTAIADEFYVQLKLHWTHP